MANKPLVVNDGIVLNNETLTQYDEGTWTPTWTSTSGTQPTIGNGSLSGKYTRIGNLVTATIWFTAGSTTTFGDAGDWRFTLPFTVTNAVSPVGNTYIVDSGTGYFAMTTIANLSSNLVTIRATNGSPNEMNRLYPMTWTSGDTAIIQVTYYV